MPEFVFKHGTVAFVIPNQRRLEIALYGSTRRYKARFSMFKGVASSVDKPCFAETKSFTEAFGLKRGARLVVLMRVDDNSDSFVQCFALKEEWRSERRRSRQDKREANRSKRSDSKRQRQEAAGVIFQQPLRRRYA